VHYLAEQVEAYLRSQTHFGDWVAVEQKHPRGTGDAVRGCQNEVKSDRFLVINGDDLFGAEDLAALADGGPGLLVHEVTDPRRYGIAFLKPDGTLERLVEKPDVDGKHLANTGAYLFPRHIFDFELKLSPRGEYEVTDYVSFLAAKERVRVVQAKFWLPIGTEEAWRKAGEQELKTVLGSSPKGAKEEREKRRLIS
jgi:dTDP-glucose pyrophosphorylase